MSDEDRLVVVNVVASTRVAEELDRPGAAPEVVELALPLPGVHERLACLLGVTQSLAMGSPSSPLCPSPCMHASHAFRARLARLCAVPPSL